MEKAENALQTWKNDELGTIRSMTIDGEPWFVAKDVSKALGYTNVQKAVRDHTDKEDRWVNETGTHPGEEAPYITDKLGRKQYPIFINESGLYALIFGSQLESAKKFKRWVTSDVLPQIRRTGSFGTAAINDQTAKALKDFEQRFDLLEAMVQKAVEAAKEASKKPDIPNVTDARERVVQQVKKAAKAVSLTERETWYELYRGYGKLTGIPLFQTARAMNMTVIDFLELIGHMEKLAAFAEQVFWFV